MVAELYWYSSLPVVVLSRAMACLCQMEVIYHLIKLHVSQVTLLH